MLLLYHQNCRIFSGELCLAISESLEYVRLYGIKAHFEYKGESLMTGECVLIAYKVFEAVLESGIPGADAVLVNLDISGDRLNLRIEMNAPNEILPQSFMADKINELGGTLVIQEIMGHADISTTMNIYAEATEKKKKEVFKNLEGKIKIS